MKSDYDLITIGGGLGGAALAKVMAAGGAKVLVLERELEFRDRVRGENLAPWGMPRPSAWVLAKISTQRKRIRCPGLLALDRIAI